MTTRPEKPWRDCQLGFLTKDEQSQFEHYFVNDDPEWTGYIRRDLVARRLYDAQIPVDIAEKILELCSSTHQGQTGWFSFPDYCLCLYLTKRYHRGFALPLTLPPTLTGDHAKAQRILDEALAGREKVAAQQRRTSQLRHSQEQLQQQQHASRTWRITPQEKERYMAIFAPKAQNGLLNGGDARAIFMQSGLDQNDLRRVWDLADLRHRGALDADEFAIAMHLTYAKLNGQPLPAALPSDLVPPSIQDLDTLNRAMRETLTRDAYSSASVKSKPTKKDEEEENMYVSKHRRQSSQAKSLTVLTAPLEDVSTANVDRSTTRVESTITEDKIVSLYRDIQRLKEQCTADAKTLSSLTQECLSISGQHQSLRTKNETLATTLLKEARALPATASSTSAEGLSIQSKAAAIIEARMKAMGLSTTPAVPTSASPTKVRSAALDTALASFDALTAKQGPMPNVFKTAPPVMPQLHKDPFLAYLPRLPFLQHLDPSFFQLPSEKPTPAVQNKAPLPLAGERPKPTTAEKPKPAVSEKPKPLAEKAVPAKVQLTEALHEIGAKGGPTRVMREAQNLLASYPSHSSIDELLAKFSNKFPELSSQLSLATSGSSREVSLDPLPTTSSPPIEKKALNTAVSTSALSPTASLSPTGTSKPAKPAKPVHLQSKPSADPNDKLVEASKPVEKPAEAPKVDVPKSSAVKAAMYFFEEKEQVVKSRMASEHTKETANVAPLFTSDDLQRGDIRALQSFAPSEEKTSPTTRWSQPSPVLMEDVFGDRFGTMENDIPTSASHVTAPPLRSEESISQEEAPTFLLTKSLYPYEPTNEDEITIEVGEFYLVDTTRDFEGTGRWDPIGWWWVTCLTGSHRTNQGWAPSTWLDIWIREEADAKEVYLHPSASNAVALFDYTAKYPDELSLAEKESIVILSPRNADGWLLALKRDTSQAGLVPENYVETIKHVPTSSSRATLGANADEVITTQVSIDDFGPSVRERAASFAAKEESERRERARTSSIQEDLSHREGPKPSQLVSQFEKRLSAVIEGGTYQIQRHSSPSTATLNRLQSKKLPIPPSQFHSSRSSLHVHTLQTNDALFHSPALPTIPGSPALTPSVPAHPAIVMETGQPGGQAETWLSHLPHAEREKIIAPLSSKERKRQEAIHELLRTEETYVQDLQIIVDVFYGPLQNMLSPTDLQKIFSNIEQLLIVNTQLFSSFEAIRMREPTIITTIADCFLQHVHALQCYVTYCGSQMVANKFLQRKRREDSRLGNFLKECLRNPRCRHLDLTSFLLEPMQRITRYTLLLKQILQYTEPQHADYMNTKRALEASNQLALRTNEAARDIENRWKIEEIGRLVDFEAAGENLPFRFNAKSNRQFIMEGPLLKAKSGRKIHAILFSDLFFLVESKNPSVDPSVMGDAASKIYHLYRPPFRVDETFIRDVESMGGAAQAAAAGLPTDECAFQIYKNQEETVNVKASSAVMKKKWLAAFTKAKSIPTHSPSTVRPAIDLLS